ncbi:hypothetical protein GW17_00010357 [Ensete ventricosum]|nr:hypothetical protein GW17_00010357 [Ensete ventricosum]RZR91155.1 hypothetical protein BHM03_00019215 [Ensete ventricosum]
MFQVLDPGWLLPRLSSHPDSTKSSAITFKNQGDGSRLGCGRTVQDDEGEGRGSGGGDDNEEADEKAELSRGHYCRRPAIREFRVNFYPSNSFVLLSPGDDDDFCDRTGARLNE